MENKEISFIKAQSLAKGYLNAVSKNTRELVSDVSEFDNKPEFYLRRTHLNYINTQIKTAIFELKSVKKILQEAVIKEAKENDMKFLDYDTLYGLIKGCTHDYDYMEKNTWGPILGRGYLKFEEYFLEFDAYHFNGFDADIEISIHNYIDPDEDEREGSDFLDDHTFVLRFKNIGQNKRPIDCIYVDDDLIDYLNDTFEFLFRYDEEWDEKELCEAFFEVLGESETWRSLFKDQEEMTKNEHQ